MSEEITDENDLGDTYELQVTIKIIKGSVHISNGFCKNCTIHLPENNIPSTITKENFKVDNLDVPNVQYSNIYKAYNNGTHLPIKIDNILFFYYKGDRSYVKTKDSKDLPLRTTDYITKIYQELDPSIFYNAGRAHIINYNAIKTIKCIDKGQVEIFITNTPDIITISRNSKKEFLEWYYNHLNNEKD